MKAARDIMTRKVITVRESTPIGEVAHLLWRHRISGVPVLDDRDRLVGVVTETDLIDQRKKVHIPTVITILDAYFFLESPKKLERDLQRMAAATAGDLCSREVVTVLEDTPVDEVATIMAEQRVHTLPVLADGRLVGVIGRRDIIRTLARR